MIALGVLLGLACATGDAAKLERKGLGEAGRAVRVGLVADAKEPLAATVGNLERFAGVFHREHVAAVLVLGDFGASEDEIAKGLIALKAAQAPIAVLPGERERDDGFAKALERAHKAGLDVIDLRAARAVAADGLALLSVPAGCDADGLGPLDAWLGEKGKPIVLVAHVPPRGAGVDAIDWAVAGNDGDRALAKRLPQLHAHVGAFAHIDEAGGRISDGAQPVAEGAWAEKLWVNVGAADAARGHGQAMLLELADGKARARVIKP